MSYLQHNFFNESECALKTDIIDNDNQYILFTDLPNFSKNNISVIYDSGYITIKATRAEEDANYIQKERFYGEYKRSYYVGSIDENNIDATYTNGVLKVVLPKKDEEISYKRIEIK